MNSKIVAALTKIIKNMKTIGVKSSGPIEVGMYFFITLYTGSIISAINFGRARIQRTESQESITSKNTIHCKISKKYMRVLKIVCIIIM